MLKANKTHISLETAKLFTWHVSKNNKLPKALCYFVPDLSSTGDGEYYKCNRDCLNHLDKDGLGIYPAYTWQEILWEYPTEFFGKDNHYNITIDNLFTNGFDYITTQIFILLQQKRYDEANLYFIKTFNL